MPTSTQRNVIHETTEYAQFNLMNANRDTSRAHIEAIKKSIEKNGNFTKFSPILVNERFEIIDGQHRFSALKELGQPIFYIVTSGSGLTEAREMNKLNKGWGMLDWAKTYANTGSRSYKNFMKLVEEYPDMAPTTVLQYALNGYERGMYSEFRDGQLVLPDQALAKTKERVDMLSEAAEIAPVVGSGTMAEAFLIAINAPGYKHKRMLAKLAEVPEVSRYMNKTDNLRHLEDIYNYHYTAVNRLRFF